MVGMDELHAVPPQLPRQPNDERQIYRSATYIRIGRDAVGGEQFSKRATPCNPIE
jgi:hypothetical protein